MATEQNYSELTLETLDRRISSIENVLKWLGRMSGLSLVILLGFAFWLGSLTSTVSTSSDTISRVYGAVSENKDSLQARTSVIESRLINVEGRLTNVESRLTNIETRLVSMDANLAELVKFRERTSVRIRPLPGPTQEP